MSLSWFIARRYLTARRRQAFISVISAVSIVGVGVGVAALIIALALMTGVQRELRDRIVGSTRTCLRLQDGRPDRHADRPRAHGRAGRRRGGARAERQGMMQSARSDGTRFQIKGIDPNLEPQVTDIKTALILGTLDALTQRPPDARDGVILGVDLARTLGVTLGDAVTLITPRAVLTPAGPCRCSASIKSSASRASATTKPMRPRRSSRSSRRRDRLGKEGPDLIQLQARGHERSAHRARAASRKTRIHVSGGGLDPTERAALFGAVAREGLHLAHHRPDRHRRGAQHRGVTGTARHGEEPGHRDPAHDGHVRARHPPHLPVAGG
jgi:hypothetical protein